MLEIGSEVMPNNKRLILVTDGSHAKIILQEHRAAPYELIQEFSQDLTSNADHPADKHGRSFESANAARHAYEPKNDWSDLQKERFVKSLADVFVKEHQSSKFPSAYLFCSPNLIQHLRNIIHPYLLKLPTTDRPIVHEYTKDLTHLSLQEIADFIDKH